MIPATTSAHCDLNQKSNQEWEEDTAITPTTHSRHFASRHAFEDKEDEEYEGENDTDPTLSGRVDGKSIKVYELDADTGIEECAELEAACLLMLGDMAWEDIQFQFGPPQMPANFSHEQRICYEEIVEMFHLADYQLKDVTVSEEGLQFVVDHCYAKRRSRQGSKREHLSEELFRWEVEEGIESRGKNSTTPAGSTQEPTYTRSGRVLERMKTYESLSQHASSSEDYLPMGPPRSRLRSTSRGIISENGVVRKVKTMGRLSLRSEFTKGTSGCNECDEDPETGTDTGAICMKDENPLNYFLSNHPIQNLGGQSSPTANQPTLASYEGWRTWGGTSSSPTRALPVSSNTSREMKNRQNETRRLTCPHLQIVTDPLDLNTLSSPLGHLKNISLESLGTVNRRSKAQRGFAIPNDATSTECGLGDSLSEGSKRLSRMQSIFVSRQLNQPKSFEEAPFSEETSNTELSRTEFDTQLQEKLYSRDEEEYTLAASQYEMTGRKYLSRSRSSSNESTKSGRSMTIEVDPELLAWMKKEILTVKVRRDSEVTVSDSNSYADSRRNSRSCFGDHSSATPVSACHSPHHSFSDAALAIAMRVPSPSRLPSESGENVRYSGGYFSSSLSRSFYMPIASEQGYETCARNENAESAISPTRISIGRLEEPDRRPEGTTGGMNANADGLNGTETVSPALHGVSLGSGIKAP